jgi:hypothetical protein
MRTDEQYSAILAVIDSSQAPINVEEKVMNRIRNAKLKRAKTRIGCFSAIGIAAFASAVPTFIWFGAAAKNSGFYEYASLFISDSKIIFVNWKLFLSSMAESLPILETMFVLSGILIFVCALRSIARAASFRNDILHSVVLH